MGATSLMSLSQPKANLPFFSAVCSTADESVFCSSTSAPALIRLCAASASFGGSNQVLTHTTLVVTFGFTLCAPRVKALMLRSTSGIGNDPTKPSTLRLRHRAGDDAETGRRPGRSACRRCPCSAPACSRWRARTSRPGTRPPPSASAPCSRTQVAKMILLPWLARSRNTRSASATFGHLLDEGGLDLVAEFGLHRLAALVVGERPAGVADRAEIDPGGFQRLGRLGGCGAAAGAARAPAGAGFFLLAAADQRCGRGRRSRPARSGCVWSNGMNGSSPGLGDFGCGTEL